MTIFNWGFRSAIKIHQSDESKSVELPSRTLKSLKFTDIIQHALPIIDQSKKLWLNPLLFNGTLQTLYYAQADSQNKFKIYYGRETFTYEDGGICSLDWTIPTPTDKDEFARLYKQTLPEDSPRLHPRSRYFTEEELAARTQYDQESTEPIVFVCHGLGGGSHEPLIRNLIENFNKKTNNAWDMVVLNNRGCCRTKITTGKLFNAMSVEDINECIIEIKKRYPKRPLYAVGFSFGAVILANYLGTVPEAHTYVKAACLIGCAWDLVDSAYHIDESWSGHYLFNPALTKFLNRIISNNFGELSSHAPKLFNEDNLALGKRQTKTWQFDDVYTCHTAGYENSMQYYRETSPAKVMHNIKVPTLCLNSTDDPAVGVRLPALETKYNPHLALVETELGGHLGWVQTNGKFWCVEVVEEFFTKYEENVL